MDFPDFGQGLQGPSDAGTTAPDPGLMAQQMAPAVPAPTTGSPNAAAVALLFSVCGALLGGSQFGIKGAAVGFLLAGSTANVWRATRLKSSPDQTLRDEAVWSGLSAVAGLGLGGYLAFQIHTERKDK